MSRFKIAVVFLLTILLLLLIGCGAEKGRTIHYDGYTIRTEKTTAETPEPERSNVERNVTSDEIRDYVLNKSSKKFHDPSCSGAAEIKEKNRWEYRGTRQSVLDMGYVPCKICNP